MPSFNRVTLIGNLTRDPHLKQLPNLTVAEFGIATNRRWKGADGQEREEACFVDCAAFGKAAEVIHQYCQKGKLLLIEGRLKYETWDDKNGAGKRHKLSVVVENFQFLGGQLSSPQSAGTSSQKQSPIEDRAQFQEADIPF